MSTTVFSSATQVYADGSYCETHLPSWSSAQHFTGSWRCDLVQAAPLVQVPVTFLIDDSTENGAFGGSSAATQQPVTALIDTSNVSTIEAL